MIIKNKDGTESVSFCLETRKGPHHLLTAAGPNWYVSLCGELQTNNMSPYVPGESPHLCRKCLEKLREGRFHKTTSEEYSKAYNLLFGETIQIMRRLDGMGVVSEAHHQPGWVSVLGKD